MQTSKKINLSPSQLFIGVGTQREDSIKSSMVNGTTYVLPVSAVKRQHLVMRDF